MFHASPLQVVLVLVVATGSRCDPDPRDHGGDAVVTRSLDASDGTTVQTLSQGWSDEDARWFYSIPQGSRLIPYDWFLHLERADDTEAFRSADNIRRLGYLPRKPSDDNTDGLPIGFTKDRGTKRAWLGLTCTACHTAQINHGGKGYLVDGAPTNGDLATLLKELEGALESLAKKRPNDKLDRFATKVLGHSPAQEELAGLQLEVKAILKVRKGFNERNLPKNPAKGFGHARYDAFGAILNEVTVGILKSEENHRDSDAPVSYPFLWDTPHHDFVQWNGIAANDALGLGNLARNAGEVLGVFGELTIPKPHPVLPGYSSSIEIRNLREIERRLEKLQSPLWPKAFPPIDQAMAQAGRAHFVTYCISCHKDIDRSNPKRKVKAMMSDVGTDPQMAKNFLDRTALTMRLENTRINFNPFGRKFGERAPAGEILIHTTVGAILGGWKTAPKDELAKLGFGMDRGGLKSMMLVPPEERFKYKARPLNGIWATAPYLHNGSVPNMYELLLPASKRSREFWVGRRDFDAKRIGFESGPGDGLFRFDSTIPGNLNTGHEYGTGVRESEGGDGKLALTDEMRWQLVEYLKGL